MIRIGHENEALSLDPNASTDDATLSVLSNVYEGLVSYDRDMALVPSLAVEWASVDDHTWQIELRPDVRFHDGTLLTAADVQRAYERARHAPDSDVRAYLEPIRSVETLGERQLRIVTHRHEPLLMSRLPYVLIGHESGSADGLAHFVGTGPYRIVQRRASELEAEAFPDYWGPKPAIARALFVPVPADARSLEVLRRHAVDVLRRFPESHALELSVPGIELVPFESLSTNYLWLDTRFGSERRNPFADLRVRQAVSHAIDRKALVQQLGGFATPLQHLVPRGVVGHVASLAVPDYDPVRARQLLHAAGYANGFEIELRHRSQVAPVGIVAEGIRRMLGAVGIRLTLRPLEQAQLIEGWRAGRLPFFLAGWRFETADAHAFLLDCASTRDPERYRGSYNAGFSNPELDRLIAEHAEIFGQDKRQAHYEKLMRLATQELPVIPLYTRSALYAVSDRIRWRPRLDGKLLAAEMSFK
jgi:peptide/nickel transport system substrate-binding protein